MSKKNLNFLTLHFRHAEKSEGLKYYRAQKMSPLLFSVLKDTEKINFLRNFGDSRMFKGETEIEIINATINELIFMGTNEFVTTLIIEFPNIFLRCSDDQIFFNIYKKAVFRAGRGIAEFVEQCEKFHAKGYVVTQFWAPKNYSQRVAENRINIIKYSNLKFLTSVIKFFS